jgi:5-formyltetrahydrofolate cyclo-ligase
MNKSELRKQLRARRTAVLPAQRRHASAQLVRHMLRSGLLLRHQRIGVYLPHRSEIDIVPLINRMQALQRHCYLPMLPFGRGKKLWFNALDATRHWVTNRFGIPENTTHKAIRARQLDLLLVPLIGFDNAGYRIGMGGGFYDASLAYLRGRQVWHKPCLVGVAFECQHITGKLPHDPWDVPLDAVLTEQGLHRFRR